MLVTPGVVGYCPTLRANVLIDSSSEVFHWVSFKVRFEESPTVLRDCTESTFCGSYPVDKGGHAGINSEPGLGGFTTEVR